MCVCVCVCVKPQEHEISSIKYNQTLYSQTL